jgi:WhiB family transcriptional regulator, redox-sensing transcriptional regulator
VLGRENRWAYQTGMGWTDSAECRESDPELFFPLTTNGPSTYQAEKARAVCVRCVVKPQCLAWSLTHHIAHGVWGGLTEQERRAIPSAVTGIAGVHGCLPSVTPR